MTVSNRPRGFWEERGRAHRHAMTLASGEQMPKSRFSWWFGTAPVPVVLVVFFTPTALHLLK